MTEATVFKQYYLTSDDTPGTLEQVGDNTIVSRGAIQSPNYSKGQAGFSLDSLGNADLNSLTTRGSATVGSLNIPDTTSANSFHVDSSGNMWLGATAFASAPAKISSAGAATFTNITITGGSIATSVFSGVISQANLSAGNQGWVQDCVFSSTAANVVAWTAGTFTTSGSVSYTIAAGNTGVMAATTYIFFDSSLSTPAYVITTTAAGAVGAGKVLVARATIGTDEATFQVYGGLGGLKLTGTDIEANSITADEVAANTITANELSTSIVYAGVISLDVGGAILSGQSGYNAGVGFFLGNDGGTAKFSIGDPAANRLTWDGTNLTIKGTLNFGGTGADGELNISSGTTTLDAGGAEVLVKNYTSISITGTASLTITNKHANGTILVLKSQGNVTISSTAPGITLNSMGADVATDGAGYPVFSSAGVVGTDAVVGVHGAGGAVGRAARFISTGTFFKSIPITCGAGGADGGEGAVFSGSKGLGGKGGGALIIECNGALDFSGTITATGANGTNSTVITFGGDGAGGGGGGGTVALVYRTLTANTGTITVTKGTGGTGAGGVDQKAGGGGSGGGSYGASEAGETGDSSNGGDGGDGGDGKYYVVQNTDIA